MNERVDVTVVLPCYNVEAYLEQALSSALQNDRIALEVICVNDGSTDGTLDIMRRFEANDARVRVIDKPNAGYGAGVNRGFDEARGRYLAILEPDDWVEPHMYDDLFELAESYARKATRYVTVPASSASGAGTTGPEAAKEDADALAADADAGWPDIVKSSYWRIWMPLTPQERRLHCSYYQRIKPKQQPFTLADCPRLIQHHPSIWSALYRRGFLCDKGIRFKEVPGAGWVDNPFLIETMCQAESIVYTDTPYYNYREDLPGSSSSNRVLALSLERWQDMCDVMDRLGVEDRGIRRALAVIGFRYVGEAVGRGALDDDELREQMAAVFRRIDQDDIRRLPNVSPQLRRLATALADRPEETFVPGPYYAALIKEFGYSVRVNGLGFALARTGVYFDRRRRQDANADPTKAHSSDMPQGM
jgi:glycosyltransferase involved in cell wall biosynthesis